MMARGIEKLFPTLEELGIGFVAYSPLANGLLSGAYEKATNKNFEAVVDYRSRMPQFTPEAMKKNEELHVEIEEGKDLIITLINISDPDESGVRTVTFMFNGAEREIRIQDKSVDMKTVSRRKADPDKAGDIGATLSGSVVNVLVSKGQKVKKGEPLVVTEAMKMETTITSPIDGTVGEIYAVKGQAIISGDCLLEVLE